MKIRQRRLGSLLLSVVMLLNLFPMTVLAAEEEWVQIYNASDLGKIVQNPSGNYHLARDIDLAGAEWSPIDSFTGKLDGNDKMISNFTISDTTASNSGLFSSVGAAGRISNLGIEGASITAGDNAGILAGENNGTISQCYTKGSISGNKYVGGLVGQNAGTIEDSFSRAEVSGKDYLGGLVGASSGIVSHSYAASSLLASVFNNYLDFNGTTGYIDIPHRDSY
ncbi:MAG: ZmpA/ZmpB/ZmpC family metallo-endopeptidase-related protein, partial [Anaerotignum sp.]|nr:ZmpA/ZmpB/ZmpC family metallo-endopeptidase-related protein [Anaerotignum sp.]